MAEHTPYDELRRRLRRVDLLLLRAVRRMRGRPQNTARGEHWGALITDDEVDELLCEAGELPPRGNPGESERRLEEAIRNAESLRDAPGPLMDALRAQHGLDGLDVDILLLALAPDVFEGYGRILAFLNDYAVMPWATVDLVARVIETRRVGRLAVLERFLPGAPLVQSRLIVLHPLDPLVQPFAWHRVQVSRSAAVHLLGLDVPIEQPAPAALSLVSEADEEPSLDAERVEDSPSVERRSLFRDLVRKWRNFVSGSGEGRSDGEPVRLESSRPEAEAARAERLDVMGHPPRYPTGDHPHAPAGLSAVERVELSQRLRRADLLLLHAVRLHRDQPWVAESARGKELMNLSLISEREVQDLLIQRGDPYLRGPSGVEPLLQASLTRREAPRGRLGELVERCDLSPMDLDILLLTMLPEISSGYRRIFQFLNAFLHDHLTVGLLARLLGQDPAGRLEVRTRLSPQGSLLRWDLVALNPVFPTQDHLPSLRVSLREPWFHYLLGLGDPPGRPLGRVIAFPGRRRPTS